MQSWREFVREVQHEKKISYKEAMKEASVLWKKKPASEKKNKTKNPKHKLVPDVSQFPKKLRFKKKNPGTYSSTSFIKRKVPDILSRSPKRRRRSTITNPGPIDDQRFRYLNTGTYNVEVQ